MIQVLSALEVKLHPRGEPNPGARLSVLLRCRLVSRGWYHAASALLGACYNCTTEQRQSVLADQALRSCLRFAAIQSRMRRGCAKGALAKPPPEQQRLISYDWQAAAVSTDYMKSVQVRFASPLPRVTPCCHVSHTPPYSTARPSV